MINPITYSLESYRRFLYDEKVNPEEIKLKDLKIQRVKIPRKLKMALANLSVPATLTLSEHLAHTLGVDVSSIPWQYVVTSAAIGLTYGITKKYTSKRMAPLHSTAYLFLNSDLFDASSYGMFYLRYGKVEKIGEWAGKVYPSPLSKFLASHVSESIPVPWAYFLGLVSFSAYMGSQTLDKKFKVVKKIKNTFLNFYNKIYDSYQKSRLNKYLMRVGTSATFAASGAPLMAAAPLTAWTVMDEVEVIKRRLK